MIRPRYTVAVAIALTAVSVTAGPPIKRNLIAPVVERDAVPLYGELTPGSAGTETWFKFEGQVVSVRNVTRPTLTPVLPDPSIATGAAVIVAPGGAMEFLSIDHEGWKIAHALADRGIAAFVLKYRLKPTPVDQAQWEADLAARLAAMRARNTASARPATETKVPAGLAPALQYPDATSDALGALALVRSNASRWGVDPRRVGMIGFSAGAAATLSSVLAARQGQGPDFFALIYGPMGRVVVPAGAPPLFAAIALDDPLFGDTSIAAAWHEAGRPAELHVYQSGGHGFGLGKPGSTNALWMEEFTTWLKMQGLLAR